MTTDYLKQELDKLEKRMLEHPEVIQQQNELFLKVLANFLAQKGYRKVGQ